MIASFVLAASLLGQPGYKKPIGPQVPGRMATGDEIEPHYGRGFIKPTPPDPKLARKWLTTPFNPAHTKFGAWNARQKSYFRWRLRPREAAHWMFSRPDLFPRHAQ